MDPILINMAMSQNTFFLTQTYNLRFFTHEIHRVSDYIPNDFMFPQMSLTLHLSDT